MQHLLQQSVHACVVDSGHRNWHALGLRALFSYGVAAACPFVDADAGADAVACCSALRTRTQRICAAAQAQALKAQRQTCVSMRRVVRNVARIRLRWP